MVINGLSTDGRFSSRNVKEGGSTVSGSAIGRKE